MKTIKKLKKKGIKTYMSEEIKDLRETILFKCKRLLKTNIDLVFNILANLDKQDEESLEKINEQLTELLSETNCVSRKVSL